MQDEYIEGFTDALDSVPIVSAEYAALEKERDELKARIVELEKALREARRSHYSCEDCWYSCPLSEDGCCNESEGTECNCGASEHNAKIDTALMVSE